MPTAIPKTAMPKQIHRAVRVPTVGTPPVVRATCNRIGAMRNAPTARSSSMIANTRCTLCECTEKPAMKSAGTTDAPRPTPTSPEPTAMSGSEGGAEPFMTRIPAARKTIPARTK